MYGLLLRALQDYVLATFDPQSWERIRIAGGFLPQGFEPLMHYNHEVLRAALRQTSSALGRPVPAILEDLGTWVVAAAYDGAPRRLLRFGGADFADFIFSLDELRDRARLALPDLVMPDLRVEDVAPGLFRLSCADSLPELSWILIGALRAMADDYGALVLIEEEAPAQGRGISLAIRLLEPRFSPGRRFDLAREADTGAARAGITPDPDAHPDGQEMPGEFGGLSQAALPLDPRAGVDFASDPGGSAPDNPAPYHGVADGLALLSQGDFARLLPLHLIVSPEGRIEAAGPLLSRMFPGQEMVGASLFHYFQLRGPGRTCTLMQLPLIGGQQLRLEQKGGGLRLRGTAFSLGDGARLLLVFSFGIDTVRAAEQLKLADSDFSVIDVALELLCLTEANALAMREMRGLSKRLERARRQAEDDALTDPLTGLRNRRASDSFLMRLCQDQSPFTLLHLDLDLFKSVNDQFGHAAGDEVLLAVAAILLRHTRTRDCVARVGGDEFIAILPGLEPSLRQDQLAEQLVVQIAQPVPWRDMVCRVSASIGVVNVGRGHAPEPADVLALADQALYAAKAAGRGRVRHCNFPPHSAAGPGQEAPVVLPGGRGAVVGK
ncbi:diguanylate cyclase [Xinfangfangia sp. D13-10-4-6]|uniref:diguanylate cyclase n=1 Tax=Pseudogemmobacter hezensis TaxID=2737662 RepID=UPI0015524224|nr:diguanylate cyclase [Pseudogemmobacter hezensis]NPD13946.1 diguanylate cyclase [Pseudogemmobacter hezensis]